MDEKKKKTLIGLFLIFSRFPKDTEHKHSFFLGGGDVESSSDKMWTKLCYRVGEKKETEEEKCTSGPAARKGMLGSQEQGRKKVKK